MLLVFLVLHAVLYCRSMMSFFPHIQCCWSFLSYMLSFIVIPCCRSFLTSNAVGLSCLTCCPLLSSHDVVLSSHPMLLVFLVLCCPLLSFLSFFPDIQCCWSFLSYMLSMLSFFPDIQCCWSFLSYMLSFIVVPCCRSFLTSNAVGLSCLTCCPLLSFHAVVLS